MSRQVELDPSVLKFSIIIHTELSDPLILHLINSIIDTVPDIYRTEILLVENISDVTELDAGSRERKRAILAQIVDLQTSKNRNGKICIKLVRTGVPKAKVTAVLGGINKANGKNMIIMNDDFTHPPDILPHMMDLIMNNGEGMVVASRYAEGGSVTGRSFVRKLLGMGAAGIARHGLSVKNVKDPVSGFIAFPKKILQGIEIDETAYSLSLEILVKSKGLDVEEIPYCFRESPTSHERVIPSVINYAKSVIQLYMHGPKSKNDGQEIKYKRSVKFLSKAGRFYTVGATGLVINYLISTAISSGSLSHLWYMQATLVGILVSIVTNFFLNKVWTFQDLNFSFTHTTKQFLLFLIISSFGAAIQLAFVYVLVENGLQYAMSLLCAVAIASASNFLLNKKLTFKDKLWG
jgi:dolichol-phosphate mannosyltransferase